MLVVGCDSGMVLQRCGLMVELRKDGGMGRWFSLTMVC